MDAQPNAVLPHVLILAGGFGTRLKKVVADVPKPLAPIAGRPFLEYQIEYLKNQGFKKFTLLTGYKAEMIESHFGDGKSFGVEVHYSVETSPLGTGGAIAKAMKSSTDKEYLVLNGDGLFACDYPRFCRLSRTAMSICLKYSQDLSRYGSVEIDKNDLVTGFLEKSATLSEGYINAGAYLIQRSCLELFPQWPFSIEVDVFQKKAGTQLLSGVVSGGPFVDIGTPESFEWAQEHLPTWLHLKPRPCLFLDRDGTLIRHKHYLHKVEDIEIIPEMVDAIRTANQRKWHVVVVTNQSGVGRGLFTEADCERVHAAIDEHLKIQGAKVDQWLSCFTHPSADRAEYRTNSLRRKPGPGMLLEACESMAVDLSKSLMIGDNSTDQIELPDLETWMIMGDFPLQLKDGNRIFKTFTSLREALETKLV